MRSHECSRGTDSRVWVQLVASKLVSDFRDRWMRFISRPERLRQVSEAAETFNLELILYFTGSKAKTGETGSISGVEVRSRAAAA